MQDNAELHKTCIQSLLLYKITNGHPHLQDEISVNQLQTCTAYSLQLSEEKQTEVPISSLWLPRTEQVEIVHGCRQIKY